MARGGGQRRGKSGSTCLERYMGECVFDGDATVAFFEISGGRVNAEIDAESEEHGEDQRASPVPLQLDNDG